MISKLIVGFLAVIALMMMLIFACGADAFDDDDNVAVDVSGPSTKAEPTAPAQYQCSNKAWSTTKAGCDDTAPKIDTGSIQTQPKSDNTRTGETKAPSYNGSRIDSNCPNPAVWSSTGPAPQDVDAAAKELGVNDGDKLFLTPLYLCKGDDTTIGWVLGTEATEKAGRILAASSVPDGACVDFDDGPSRISGEVEWQKDYTVTNSRALLAEESSVRGLKFTFYWTPCEP